MCEARLTAHSLWREGFNVKPTAGVRSSCSSDTPGGGVKRKCCCKEVKKRKSSILARLSPRHTLRPEHREVALKLTALLSTTLTRQKHLKLPAEKGMKASFLTNRPCSSRKCAGLKVSGLSHWLSSLNTDVRRGITQVPFKKKQKTFTCQSI